MAGLSWQGLLFLPKPKKGHHLEWPWPILGRRKPVCVKANSVADFGVSNRYAPFFFDDVQSARDAAPFAFLSRSETPT